MNEDFREFFHVVFKRRRFALITFLVIAVPAIAIAMLRPSMYRATGKLLLTDNRSYLQLSAQDSKRITQILLNQALAAEAENLKNRSFLQAVADNLQIEILPQPVPENREERNRHTAAAILAGLEVNPYPTSPDIEVAYSNPDRAKAAAVVNTIAETYVRYRPGIYESPDLPSFYARRVSRLQHELRAEERRLERYQRKTGILSLQQEKDESIRQMMATQLTLNETVAQINQTNELIASLEESNKKQPETVTGDVDMIDNPVARALQERIGILTVELSDLRQRYTDSDRHVQDKLGQIQELKSEVAKQPLQIVGTQRFQLNQLRENLQEELYRADANRDALVAKRASLDKAIEGIQKHVETMNSRGVKLQELDDSVQAKRAELDTTVKQAQQVKLSADMSAEGTFDSVRIVDHAVPPSIPANQNTWLIVAIAVVAGLGLGVGGAFGLEFLYRTYHFASDIDRELELPVLGLITDFDQVTSTAAAR
jgi:uncharacterized protein involved in exopolysaccharide biosynthesis